MTKRLNKFDLRQGFCYYLLATLALALIFFSYIFRGASTDMMTPIGWIYFTTSCLTHAAIYYYPGCKPGKRDYRTTHYDLSPTLLHQVVGVTNPPSDFSTGHYLSDRAPRNWHLAGNDLYYAFTLTDGTIVEKRGSGSLKVLDRRMRPMPNYQLNARELQEALRNMNRFFK